MRALCSGGSRTATTQCALERTADTLSRPHDQYRAVGVTDDGIGDIAHEGPFHSAEPAAAYHYQVGVYLLGEVDDRFVSPFAHPEVGDRDAATRLLDLPDLFVEYLLSLAPESLAPRLSLGVELVDSLGERLPDRDDVEPRPDLLR